MQGTFKILYAAAEIAPFVKTTAMAEAANSLARALKDFGHDIRLFIPKYSVINDRKYTIREVIRLKAIKVAMGDKVSYVDVKSAFLPNSKVQVYFVENKDFFDRPDPFIDPETGQPYSDNAERFSFFCNAIFVILTKLHWQPDIIHCNDWHTALIPYLLKYIYEKDPFYSKIKTLLSIHDLSAQGVFNAEVLPSIGFPQEIFTPNSPFEHNGKVNLLKAGLLSADFINTTSKIYAKQIQTSMEASFGLQDTFRIRAKNIVGIPSGANYSVWNPETDPLIPYQFSKKDFRGKLQNKEHLLAALGMPFKQELPLIGIPLQNLSQDAQTTIVAALNEIIQLNVQLLLYGGGSTSLQKSLQSVVKKNPQKIAFQFQYDEAFEHLVVAGCDLFFNPCKIEPCGSIDIYCLKYGTIPIVHESIGVMDLIKSYDATMNKGNCFTYSDYSVPSMMQAVIAAINLFKDDANWRKLMDRNMRLNFSWELAAENYQKLYEKIIN
ncbi:MAG: glycogen synthase [candidate division KSB1 bacterium]|nr:glycogen synthase [candidate division KSB1 bacterium]MDZ7334014.1 glycogen synthase [candidate division KSB1 bacterium]MDZ7357449.1 glycogen synthase [candidate division KSB1 bacterium]MDZ7375109.1 glycogen synthase [candidate division KSB1 bacterium]MDZ7399999.1 glycogen synthase [candidate division KSB1 bacterium]